MLARSTNIRHPSGDMVQTPLLVPSFSSKGFAADKKGKSEIAAIFDVASELISDTMLVSAYDLHYGHLNPFESAIADLTFVDSGGYEISNDHDLSAIFLQTSVADDWTPEMLQDVLDEWPEHIPSVFVSFDQPKRRLSIEDQIKEARSFLAPYTRQLRTLLVKPETTDQDYVQYPKIVAHAGDLGDFDIIGLTEKELGNSIIQRMTRIAKIRQAMDNEGVGAPIHIYGSLDPITSVLYFLCGAEIFDGLTWLRYGFIDGMACYYHNYGSVHNGIGIHSTDEFVRARMIQDNLGYLVNLTHQMQKFLVDGGNFSHFQSHANMFKDSFDLLRTKVKGI